MCAIKRPIIFDQRLAKQLATWAIKKDIVRALVELITNSDDSYRRLAYQGFNTSGIIHVMINRKRKGNTILKILDEAEGFDDKTMEERVGTYASETSGFAEGMDVRGYFGRGLKDAIIGLGEGYIQSIRDNYYYECYLTQDYFELEKPQKLKRNELKKIEESFNLKNHGTLITIVMLPI